LILADDDAAFSAFDLSENNYIYKNNPASIIESTSSSTFIGSNH